MDHRCRVARGNRRVARTESNPAARPLANHPGNVFLAAEDVSVLLSAEDGTTWQAVDYDGKPLASGTVQGGKARLGRLPLGYYELAARRGGGGHHDWHPCPASGPSFRVVADRQRRGHVLVLSDGCAESCGGQPLQTGGHRLGPRSDDVGRNRARPGTVRTAQRATTSRPSIQSEAGLRVLQVHHSTPAWAGRSSKHFPEDLRDLYRFLRQMAARWKGRVQAFEPWNEADVDNFGGQTGSEMATLQKAGYLGIKAGNPDAIACLNVFAIARPDTLDDFAANGAWPYFDTCNLHHYIQPGDFPKWYAAFRRISAGRPLWVTEFNQPVRWAGDAKAQEPTAADQRLQAQRVPILFASSLHEGTAEAFYFLFPHYIEGQIQFGIVHRDLTPRPAYLALAAVGRLLADARPLGRLKTSSRPVRAYLFPGAARRPGCGRLGGMDDRAQRRVATARRAHRALRPYRPQPAADGRGVAIESQAGLCRPAAGRRIAINARSATREAPAARGEAVACRAPVRLAAHRVVLDKSAYRVTAGQDVAAAVFAYNFSESPVAGKLTVAAPNGWTVSIPDRVESLPASGNRWRSACSRPSQRAAARREFSLAAISVRRARRSLAFGCNLKRSSNEVRDERAALRIRLTQIGRPVL